MRQGAVMDARGGNDTGGGQFPHGGMMQNPQYVDNNCRTCLTAWAEMELGIIACQILYAKEPRMNSTEVKQQFEQIGLTPEEVAAKSMANPEVAVAFQDPKVQAASMDSSTNPLNITKYQNDKQVTDVFNKIS